MAGETEFKKSDGDILYGTDVNKMGYRVFAAFEQETLSVTDSTDSVSYSAERDYHIIKNIGSNECYINFDAAATTSSYILYPNEIYIVETNATAIHAICNSSETTTLRIIGQA